jgi:adenylate cyclase
MFFLFNVYLGLMKKALALLFLFFTVFCNAQTIPMLTKDSLVRHTKYQLDKWKFQAGDDAAMATPAYDDSKWATVDPDFRIDPGNRTRHNKFSSIGWFRFHFIADTSLVGIPLAFGISHYGASEIFLDGKKIESFGKIKGESDSGYYDPQYLPFTFVIRNAGEHVIAVRYANYTAQHYFNIFRTDFSGFKMYMGRADELVFDAAVRADNNTFYPVLIFGVFITLFALHLLLFLYYRSVRSNLYFSIFCLCFGLAFLIYYLGQSTNDPHTMHYITVATLAVFSLICISLSGFSNELFSPNKWRLRAVTILGIAAMAIYYIASDVSAILYCVLVGFVLIETIAATIKGMVRKVKGAKILGAGILFFTVFLTTCILIALLKNGGLSFTNEVIADIFIYVALCALLSIPASMSIYLSWSVASMNQDLKKHLQQVEVLSKQALEQEQEKKQILEGQKQQLEQEVAIRTSEVVARNKEIEKQHEELKTEKKKSDDLLLNILPSEIAEELKEKGHSDARVFNDVTVLFTDFVDFTKAGERMGPQELVNELHICFKNFDEILSRHNIEKIKTIGDAYLAVCGLPLPERGHAVSTVTAATEIIKFMEERKKQLKDKTFDIRIGIHSGSVVAGIVGVKKFAYDIWGDTVNTAARMEQNSEPGKINISQATYDLVKNKFECTFRGEIQAKNKGGLSMYFVGNNSV